MRSLCKQQGHPERQRSLNRTQPHPLASSALHHAHPILQLQRTIGNLAVQRLLRDHCEDLQANSGTTATVGLAHDARRRPVDARAPARIQTKLTVSTPGDLDEQEADTVADAVMRMPQPLNMPQGAGRVPDLLQREVADCDEELQRRPAQTESDSLPTAATTGARQAAIGERTPDRTAAADATASYLDAMRGSGQPLSASDRAFFEPRFGYDFSHVRIHTDAAAARSAREVNALAYTVGRDIVFGAARYAPDTSEGKKLLAHELTHTIQQGHSVRLPAVALKTKPVDEQDSREATTPTPLVSEVRPTDTAPRTARIMSRQPDDDNKSLRDMVQGVRDIIGYQGEIIRLNGLRMKDLLETLDAIDKQALSELWTFNKQGLPINVSRLDLAIEVVWDKKYAGIVGIPEFEQVLQEGIEQVIPAARHADQHAEIREYLGLTPSAPKSRGRTTAAAPAASAFTQAQPQDITGDPRAIAQAEITAEERTILPVGDEKIKEVTQELKDIDVSLAEFTSKKKRSDEDKAKKKELVTKRAEIKSRLDQLKSLVGRKEIEYNILNVYPEHQNEPHMAVKKWFDQIVTNATFLGMPIGSSGGSVPGVHKELLDRLRAAETILKGLVDQEVQDKLASHQEVQQPSSDRDYAKYVGLYSIGGLRSPKTSAGGTKVSLHSYGLAIDVNYAGNPFVGLYEPPKTKKSQPIPRAEDVIENATLLVKGHKLSISTTPHKDASKLWEHLHDISETLKTYLSLRLDENKDELEKLVKARQDAGDQRTVDDWKKLIETNYEAIKNKGDWQGHTDPAVGGFMDLNKLLVIALTRAELSWGGSYSGADGKDIMHFDWRGGSLKRR